MLTLAGRRGKAQHDRVRAAEQALGIDLGGDEAVEDERVLSRAGVVVVDRIVAEAAAEAVGVRAAAAGHQVVAGAGHEHVVSCEADDRVVVGRRDVHERALAHVVTGPDGPVREGDLLHARARSEHVLQDQAIARTREADHEVEALGSAAQGVEHVCDVVVDELDPVGAARVADPVVAVPGGVAEDVVTGPAHDQVVALAAHDRIVAVRADDEVVGGRREAEHELRADVGERKGDARIDEDHALDLVVAGARQPADYEDLVARIRQADDQVARSRTTPIEADLVERVAVDLDAVAGCAALVANRVGAVAAAVDVDVVAAEAADRVVATAAFDHVAGAGADDDVRPVRLARRDEQRTVVRLGPDRAVVEGDLLDATLADGVDRALERDAPAVPGAGRAVGNDDDEVRAEPATEDHRARIDALEPQPVVVLPLRLADHVVAVAVAPDEDVVAGLADEQVVAGAAGDDIAPPVAGDRVLARAVEAREIGGAQILE